jgi:CRP/FNR family transcriptional regulator, cyclic AMP receptor protein
MNKEIFDAFRKSDFLRVLRPDDIEHLVCLSKPRSFTPNEVIFRQGDTGYSLYIVTRGRVKICVLDQEGMELIFTFLSSGDILGEMAILDGGKRSATAVAVEQTETIYIDRPDFLSFLSSSPAASLGIISVLSKRLRDTNKHWEEFALMDVASRSARRLLEEIEVEKNGNIQKQTDVLYISQEELGRLVGASRVMVNRVLNSLVDSGMIKIGRKKIIVMDKLKLKELARLDR